MNNRRKLKRRHLIYYLRVFNLQNGEILGHLVDITNEGIMLISEEPISSNTLYHLKMDLPSPMNDKNEVHFSARSIYSKKDINPDFYATGFELLDGDRDFVHIIEQLIIEFGFND